MDVFVGDSDDRLDQNDERWLEFGVLEMGKVRDARLEAVVSLGDVDLAVLLVLP